LSLDGDVEGGGGFVGDEQAGSIDESHGNEDALALASGELVRIVAEARFGVGEGDFVEGGDDFFADNGARGAGVVGEEGFGDLGADAHDRVEGGHGLLEDHGDGLAAEGTDPGFGEGEDGLAVEEDLAGDAGGWGEKTQEGERGGGFSGAGFADQAEGLAGSEGEGDGVDDGFGAEGDGEVRDFEELGVGGSVGHADWVRVAGLEWGEKISRRCASKRL